MNSFLSKGIMVALAVFIFFSGTSVSFAASKEPDRVAEKDAITAALWHYHNEINTVSDESLWKKKGVKLLKPVHVYDPAGNHVAYLVNFRSKIASEKLGYVMVSAFLDEEPIIMWSDEGEAFSSDKVKDKLNDDKTKIEKNDVIWFGGSYFAARFKVKGKTQQEVITQDFSQASASELKAMEKMVYPAPTTEKKEIREIWKLIKNSPLGDVGTDSDGVTNDDPAIFVKDYDYIDSYFISTAYNMKQWHYTYTNGVGQATGCSPTAASNIIMFLSKSFSGLVPTGKTQRDVVMELRTYMNTSQSSSGVGTTDPYHIDDGLRTYLQKHGRTNVTITNNYLATYENYKDTLKTYKRPMLQSYWNQDYFGDHTLTVQGYKEFVRSGVTSNSRYLVVYNNFIGEASGVLYVKFGTWNANMATFVKSVS